MTRCLLVFAFVFTGLTTSVAQEIRGHVSLENIPGIRKPQIEITATLVSNTATSVSGIAGSDGQFSLAVPQKGRYYVSLRNYNVADTAFYVQVKDDVDLIDIKNYHPRECIYKTRTSRACPIGSHTDYVIPIVYGLPTPEALDKAALDEIKLAGCIVSVCDPRLHCKKHDLDF